MRILQIIDNDKVSSAKRYAQELDIALKANSHISSIYQLPFKQEPNINDLNNKISLNDYIFIHCQSNHQSRYINEIIKLKGFKIVFIHASTVKEMYTQIDKNYIKVILAYANKIAIKNNCKVIYDELVKILGKKPIDNKMFGYDIIYNFEKRGDWKQLSEKKKSILFVNHSTLSDIKKYVSISNGINKKYDDFEFDIYGVSNSIQLLSISDNIELEKNIHLKKTILQDEFNDELGKSFILFQNIEKVTYSLLDAISYGTLVSSFKDSLDNISINNSKLSQAKCILEYKDIDSYITNIDALLKNKTIYESFRNNTYETFKYLYDPNKNLERLFGNIEK